VQNKQYSAIKNNYEITFDMTSDIKAANDDTDIKSQMYNFMKIDALPNVDVNSNVDLVCIVRSASDVSEITTKKGDRMVKRELTLVDDTLSEVRMTLWGEKAENNAIPWADGPIVAFKGVRG
jgi:replication factor A1